MFDSGLVAQHSPGIQETKLQLLVGIVKLSVCHCYIKMQRQYRKYQEMPLSVLQKF